MAVQRLDTTKAGFLEQCSTLDENTTAILVELCGNVKDLLREQNSKVLLQPTDILDRP